MMSMLPRIAGAFLCVAALAPAARGESGASTARDVRVMSFNVRYGSAQDGPDRWENRRDFLAATIKKFDPDLLGTQETLSFQRDFLQAQLAGMTTWGAGREDGLEKGEMCSLFYRTDRFDRKDGGHFWLSEKPDQPGSRSWDAAITRMVSWVKLTDRRAPEAPVILFLNTHLDHKGGVARRESAKLLRDRIADMGKGCRVILTGDFNTAEQSDPYKALFGERDGVESPVFDAFRLANQQPGNEEGTFNGFKPDATTGPRIDWIGISLDWMPVKVFIERSARDGRTPSDHFPVCAILAPP